MSDTSRDNTAPPLDFERLQLVAETDDDKAALLGLFFRMANDFSTAMDNAKQPEQFAEWRNAAHSLKGAAGNLGMTPLETICREAEHAETHTFEQRTELIAQLRSAVAQLKTYLKETQPSLFIPGI